MEDAKKIIAILKQELNKENLSSEERMEIIRVLSNLADKLIYYHNAMY